MGELTDCHRPVRTGLGGGWRGTRCSPPWHLVESPILEMRVAHHGPGIAAETVPGRNSRTDSRVRTGSKNRICIGIRNCSGVRPAVRLSLPLVRLSRPLLMSCAAQGGFRGWSNPRCCSSDSSLRSDGGAADARALAPGGPGGRTGLAAAAPTPTGGLAAACLFFPRFSCPVPAVRGGPRGHEQG